MRKGLTLSLAATASLLTASAAYAYGPTIAGVPDVYIAKNTTSGADSFTNVYRFENALTITDYVTPGVTSGNGSTSATLYWGYGIRATVGSGSYYAPAAAADQILYKIGAPAGSAITPLQIAATPGSLAWKNEINVTNGASLKQMSAFGRLSFYNVALSPLPSANAGSDPYVTSPTLGAQREATLYVTDLSTTPGSASFLVVTTGINTDVDTLSGGGALCATEVNYTTTSSWSAFEFGPDWGGSGVGDFTTAPNLITTTNSGTSLSITTQVSASGIPSGGSLYGQYSVQAIPVNTSKVYRLKAAVTSSNTAGSGADPTLITELSGGVAGIGYYSATGSTFVDVLTGSTPKCVTSYLWPVANGNAAPIIIVFDSFPTAGGTITAQSIRVDSFNPANLIGSTVLYDAGTGAASSFAVASSGTNGSWNTGLSLVFSTSSSNPNFTYSPSSAGNSNTLAIGTAGSSSSNTQAMANWVGQELYTTAANRLVVIKGNVKTANLSNSYPKPWLIVDGTVAKGGSGMIAQSSIDAGGGNLTTSGIDIRLVYDSFGATPNTVTFRAFASATSTATINGDVTLTRLTATQYTAPACVCP